jgi:tetratricopeptide (TPR) repeat protein
LNAERRVTVLDPRDADAVADLAASHIALREFDRGETTARRALILDPANGNALLFLWTALVLGRGDTAAGRAALAQAPTVQPWFLANAHAVLARWARQFDSSDAALARAPFQFTTDGVDHLVFAALNDRAAGNAARAAQRADSAARLARAFLASHANGDVFGNRANFYTLLGLAEAIQGKAADAVRDGEQAVQMNPPSRDVLEAPRSAEGLIEIHVLLGHREDAIRLITEDASRPTNHWGLTSVFLVTPGVILHDPLYDDIRNDPRMQALLKNEQAWVVK